jgi:hypothetical protein
MHDRAVTLTGAVKTAVAIAIEIMILLNIALRIAQVRPRVEEKRSALSGLTRILALFGLGNHIYDYEYEIFWVAPCNGPLVNCESFRGCDQYVSCHYGEQRKSFERRQL